MSEWGYDLFLEAILSGFVIKNDRISHFVDGLAEWKTAQREGMGNKSKE